MTCNFTYNHYQEIIGKFLDNGYKFYRFDEYNKAKGKSVLLRHDIDSCIDSAFRMGEIEHRMGVKSTFFIRLQSPLYNPFSFNNIIKIVTLLNCGHEIGIHYEGAIPFDHIKKSMENIYGIKIHSASIHEPRKIWDIDSKYKINEAYSDKFIKKIKYLSDSSIVPLTKGRWREGCMCQQVGKYKKLQILTHPILWYNESSLENY